MIFLAGQVGMTIPNLFYFSFFFLGILPSCLKVVGGGSLQDFSVSPRPFGFWFLGFWYCHDRMRLKSMNLFIEIKSREWITFSVWSTIMPFPKGGRHLNPQNTASCQLSSICQGNTGQQLSHQHSGPRMVDGGFNHSDDMQGSGQTCTTHKYRQELSEKAKNKQKCH